jgi:hypothetical protein
MKTFEIILSGNHPDIFVIIEADENTSKEKLLELAIAEFTKNTYIWSVKVQ